MGHKKNSSYRELGKALKKFGLVDYDLRRELNNGQKAQITKLAKEYSQLIRKPETFYTPTVSKKQKSGLKTAGYTVTKGGKALIPLHGYKSAKLKGAHLELKGGEGGRSEKIILAGSKEFFDTLRNYSARSKNLPRNQMLTVQIGDNNAFSSRFRSYWELYQYLTKWAPKDEGESRERIMARMSIVTIDQPPAPKQKVDRKDSSRSRRKGK